jgi:uncharacterized protein with GYD domain
MPKFMISAHYTPEGMRGMRKETASVRRRAVEEHLKAIGGRLESMHFMFGEDDVVIIFEAPGNVEVAALSSAVAASGLIQTRTTVLLTVEEMDAAFAKNVSFRGPGQ